MFGAAALALALSPIATTAQGLAGKILLEAEARTSPASRTLILHFACPLQLLDHAPEQQGDSLLALIRLAPECGNLLAPSRSVRRHAVVPPRLRDLVEDVQFEQDPIHGPRIRIRFRNPTPFLLRMRRDFRAIVITLPNPGDSPLPDKRISP